MTPPIAVYGATGYTGRLVVAELRRRALPVVLSGRREDALLEVARAHGLDRHAVRAAATGDPPALRAAFTGCGAVIACAGPFLEVGEPVLRAALEAGCHYVDTTGEEPFMRRAMAKYGGLAERGGLTAVPGMGFDYLPGDLLCAIAAEGLGPLRELTIAYALAGFGATRGTMRSALLMMGRAPALGPLRETFDFGPPVGRVPVAAYSSGEVLTVPRHVDVPQVRSRITAATFAPHPRLARAVPVLTPPIALALRTPLRGALHRAIGRLPEGPSESARRAARYTLVAEAVPRTGAPRRATLHGTDVYGITAVTTVHGAALLAGGEGLTAGVVAPAEAFAPRAFLDALGPHGITYAVD